VTDERQEYADAKHFKRPLAAKDERSQQARVQARPILRNDANHDHGESQKVQYTVRRQIGLYEDQIGQAIQRMLGFVAANVPRRAEWLVEPDLMGPNLLGADPRYATDFLPRTDGAGCSPGGGGASGSWWPWPRLCQELRTQELAGVLWPTWRRFDPSSSPSASLPQGRVFSSELAGN